MTRQDPTDPIDCRRVVRDLFHHEAGELPDPQMRAISRHLEQCPDCRRRERIENAFRRSIQSGAQQVAAPPGLAERLSASLEGDGRRAERSNWLRAPWLLPVAATLLLAALLSPGLPRLTGVVDVEREVVVVDIDCELMGVSLARQRRCDHPHHLNALRSGEGSYWSVALDDETGRRIASDRALRGARLAVRGNLYSRIRTLRVESYERIGDEAVTGRSSSVPGNRGILWDRGTFENVLNTTGFSVPAEVNGWVR